jgi:hypothetical protein
MATLMALALLVALTAVTGLPAFAGDWGSKDRKCCSTFSQKNTSYQSGTNYIDDGDHNNQANVLLSAQQNNATSGDGDIKDNDVGNGNYVEVDQD